MNNMFTIYALYNNHDVLVGHYANQRLAQDAMIQGIKDDYGIDDIDWLDKAFVDIIAGYYVKPIRVISD